MTDNKTNIVIWVGMIVYIFLNMVYDFYCPIKGVWYVGNAFAFVCYSYALHRCINNTTSQILLAVVCSQFLDELYGNPTEANLIEYVGFFAILGFFFLKDKKVFKIKTKK